MVVPVSRRSGHIGPLRHIFDRHFLLGKLSRDEIDTLLHYARMERLPRGPRDLRQGLSRTEPHGRIERDCQDDLGFDRRKGNRL